MLLGPNIFYPCYNFLFYFYVCIIRAFQAMLVVKNPPANAANVRDPGLIPGSGRSPGGGHSNPLWYAWRIPLTEEPDKLQFIGSQRTGHD